MCKKIRWALKLRSPLEGGVARESIADDSLELLDSRDEGGDSAT